MWYFSYYINEKEKVFSKCYDNSYNKDKMLVVAVKNLVLIDRENW